MLLGRAGNCAGDMDHHRPLLATGRQTVDAWLHLSQGWALDRASLQPVCSCLSSAGKFLFSCTSTLFLCTRATVLWHCCAGGALPACGVGAGAAPCLGTHRSNLSALTWCRGGLWRVTPVSHHFWGDKLTVLCLPLPAWKSWLCAFLGFPSCLSN